MTDKISVSCPITANILQFKRLKIFLVLLILSDGHYEYNGITKTDDNKIDNSGDSLDFSLSVIIILYTIHCSMAR